MAENWVQIAKDVQNTFLEESMSFLIKRTILGSYDPLLGTYSETESQEFTIPGLFASFSSQLSYQEGLEMHSVERGDMLLYLANDAEYAPKVGDILYYKEEAWFMQGFTPTRPGGYDLFFMCSLTRN